MRLEISSQSVLTKINGISFTFSYSSCTYGKSSSANFEWSANRLRPQTKITAAVIIDYFLGTVGLTEDEAPFLEQNTGSCSGEFDLFPQYDEENKTVNAKLIYHPDTLEIIGGQLISQEFLLSDLNLLADIVKHKTTIPQLAVEDFGFLSEYTSRFHYLNELAFKVLAKRANIIE